MTCPFCDGSGECAKCDGTGLRTIHKHWPLRDVEVPCRACQGSGVCDLCKGEGKRETES
jgi:excinuclease UvrABC ATPase subunit